MKKTVAYYRNSTDLQENSIQMQKSMALTYSSKNRIIIDEEFEDIDTSARKLGLKDRTGIHKIQKQIEKGLIEGIVVYKRDRLARNVQEHLELYQLFKTHHIKVHFTSQNEVPMMYTPVGEYLETILGAMAEHEGKQIALRILETRIANYTKGIKLGNLPFGFKKIEVENELPKIEIDEDEIKIVKAIFDTLLHGNHENVSSITRYLRENDFIRMTKKGKERSWDETQLKEIIGNMMYAGTRIMKFGNEKYERKYDDLAIVTEKEWLDANAIFEKILENKKGKVKFRCPILKFLYCKECKANLVLSKQMVGGTNYRIVNCENEECKTRAFLDDVEHNIKVQSDFYFQNLLSNHFSELYKRQQKANVNRLNTIIEKNFQLVKGLEDEAIKRTEKFIKSKNQLHKDNLVDCYRKLKEIKKEIAFYFEKLEEINKFMDKIKKSHDLFKGNVLEKVSIDELDIFYTDIIESVHIGKYEIDFQFKHPFFTAKEMYNHDTKTTNLS
ncbi:recombinase family protein [Rossellomorea sp. GAMAL-10_SWC]